MDYVEAREQIFDVVQKSVAVGLVRIAAGNFSQRTADGHVAITPGRIPYDQLKMEQIAIVDLDGNHIDGPCKASSETPMHTFILRSLPQVGAVCHTHSLFAMTFAAVGREIPMVNTELILCGAPIPVAEWTCPGSLAAGEVSADIFRERPELKVLLLRNHGGVSIGEDVHQAFKHAYDAEIGAEVYYRALQIGQPIVITEAQVQELFGYLSAFEKKKI